MSKKQAVIDATEKISMEDLQNALTLSPAVERRVNALMNLHDKYIEVNKKYQEEVRALERKYAEQYKPLFEKRENIIGGKYEPTDEEAKYGDDAEEEQPKKDVKKEDKKEEEKGIPNFWLTALQNNSNVSPIISENDSEALEFLTDIRTSNFENGEEGSGFELTFHFAENPYFSNAVLTKKYFLELDDMFGEYNLDHSEGCKIEWKAGKNLTVKTVKKKVQGKKGKGGAKGGPRTVTVEEPAESFFRFFTPPQPTEQDEEEDEEDEEQEEDENAELVEMDFDIGNRIRDTIVPFAVLWFTGDAADFEDNFDEYPFGMGEDDEEDEEDDEEEEEEEPKGRGGRGGRGGGAGGKGGKAQQGHQFAPPKTGSNIPQPQQPECKQQ